MRLGQYLTITPTYSEILINGTIVTKNQNSDKDNNDVFSFNGIQKTTTTINPNSSPSNKINNLKSISYPIRTTSLIEMHQFPTSTN